MTPSKSKAITGADIFSISPNLSSILRSAVELVTLLHPECFVEFRKIRERAIHAEAGRRVRIGEHLGLPELRSFLFTFSRRIAEEETLFRGVPVDIFAAGLLETKLVRVKSDGDTTEVGDVLAERELAVHVHAGFNFIAIELVLETLRFL